MKTLSSFLIIFIFTTLTLNSPPSTANHYNGCDKFICDDNWNHAKSHKTYRLGPPPVNNQYIVDVKLESTIADQPCPRNVILVDEDNGIFGDYFTIIPILATEDGRVPIETPFSISAVKKSDSCDETDRYLRMTRRNKKLKFWHVTGDGEFNTSASCFQFINFPAPTDYLYTPTYLLQNCPFKCGRGTGECFDVGNRTKGENIYLTSGGYPFEFSLRGTDSGDLDVSI